MTDKQLSRIIAKIDRFMDSASWYVLGFFVVYLVAQVIRAVTR